MDIFWAILASNQATFQKNNVATHLVSGSVKIVTYWSKLNKVQLYLILKLW